MVSFLFDLLFRKRFCILNNLRSGPNSLRFHVFSFFRSLFQFRMLCCLLLEMRASQFAYPALPISISMWSTVEPCTDSCFFCLFVCFSLLLLAFAASQTRNQGTNCFVFWFNVHLFLIADKLLISLPARLDLSETKPCVNV